MTLVINLSPELEAQLREKAIHQGQDVNIVVGSILTSVLESESHEFSTNLPIINAEQAVKNKAAIDLLDSWLGDDEDAAEHEQTWAFLKTALDEDRLSDRPLFL
jgi:hypothetical protein